MLFNVPQFIDVEDKIAGPLTAKQVFWLIGAGAILFIIWAIFDLATFFTLAVPIVILFALFAFYRPYNQSFLSFAFNSVLFLFRPKVYRWERPTNLKAHKESPAPAPTPTNDKKLTFEEIHALAEIADRKKK